MRAVGCRIIYIILLILFIYVHLFNHEYLCHRNLADFYFLLYNILHFFLFYAISMPREKHYPEPTFPGSHPPG